MNETGGNKKNKTPSTANNEVVEKAGFALDIEGGWPPVSVEHVWCRRDGNLYQLENAPFFIKGLSFGDRFRAEPDPVNGLIFEVELVEASGHSLVWMMDRKGQDISASRQELLRLGCRVEGFAQFGLHAVDVPPSIDRKAINDAVDTIEARGFPMAFPVWRHKPDEVRE